MTISEGVYAQLEHDYRATVLRSVVSYLSAELKLRPSSLASSSREDLSNLDTLVFLASLGQQRFFPNFSSENHPEWRVFSRSGVTLFSCLTPDTLRLVGKYLATLPGFNSSLLWFEEQSDQTVEAHKRAQAKVLSSPAAVAEKLLTALKRKTFSAKRMSFEGRRTVTEHIQEESANLSAISAIRGGSGLIRLNAALRVARAASTNRAGDRGRPFKVLVVSDLEEIRSTLYFDSRSAGHAEVSYMSFKDFVSDDIPARSSTIVSSSNVFGLSRRQSPGHDFVVLHDCVGKAAMLAVLPAQYRAQRIGMALTGPLDQNMTPEEQEVWSCYSCNALLTLLCSKSDIASKDERVSLVG